MLALCEYREKELDVDEEYDVDGGLDMYESRKKKGTKVGSKVTLAALSSANAYPTSL